MSEVFFSNVSAFVFVECTLYHGEFASLGTVHQCLLYEFQVLCVGAPGGLEVGDDGSPSTGLPSGDRPGRRWHFERLRSWD